MFRLMIYCLSVCLRATKWIDMHIERSYTVFTVKESQ